MKDGIAIGTKERVGVGRERVLSEMQTIKQYLRAKERHPQRVVDDDCCLA